MQVACNRVLAAATAATVAAIAAATLAAAALAAAAAATVLRPICAAVRVARGAHTYIA